LSIIRYNKENYYASSVEAVFTYRISKKDVGIRIKSAVAVKPKIFTSITFRN